MNILMLIKIVGFKFDDRLRKETIGERGFILHD